MMKFLKLACTGLVTAALAACGGGGGGGGGGDAMEVEFAPASVSATFRTSFDSRYVNDNWPDWTEIVATFSESPKSESFRIEADQQIVADGYVAVKKVSPTEFRARFRLDPTLDPGVYAGNFRLVLCKDQACSARESVEGGVLPYKITVKPGFTVWLKVGDGLGDSPKARYSGERITIDVPADELLNFEANTRTTYQLTTCGGESGGVYEKQYMHSLLWFRVRVNPEHECQVKVLATPVGIQEEPIEFTFNVR